MQKPSHLQLLHSGVIMIRLLSGKHHWACCPELAVYSVCLAVMTLTQYRAELGLQDLNLKT